MGPSGPPPPQAQPRGTTAAGAPPPPPPKLAQLAPQALPWGGAPPRRAVRGGLAPPLGTAHMPSGTTRGRQGRAPKPSARRQGDPPNQGRPLGTHKSGRPAGGAGAGGAGAAGSRGGEPPPQGASPPKEHPPRRSRERRRRRRRRTNGTNAPANGNVGHKKKYANSNNFIRFIRQSSPNISYDCNHID